MISRVLCVGFFVIAALAAMPGLGQKLVRLFERMQSMMATAWGNGGNVQ